MDIRAVKEWLGHSDIQATMRYLHYVEGHALKKFVEAEKAELLELAGSSDKVATQ
jgi:site-specific recombinase XerD